MRVELVLDAKAEIGESPLWIPSEDALYWVDIKAPALYRYIPANGEQKSWRLPEDVGAFALDGFGRALVALRSGLFWLYLDDCSLILAAHAPFDPHIVRFNEGACDSAGRFWVGTMTDPLPGETADVQALLHSFTSTEGLVPHRDFTFLANGMAWNADETLFYLSHSQERKIYRFEYDNKNGKLGGKTEFAALKDTPGIPDGAAIDEAGDYWCAIHGGGRLHRYTKTGKLAEVVKLPVSQPTMCCFAGPRLDELYITSAREKLSDSDLVHEPYAGGLFRLRPLVPGQPKYWCVS